MSSERIIAVERVGLSGPRAKPLAEQDTTHAESASWTLADSTGADIKLTDSYGSVRRWLTPHPSAPEVAA